jgi:TonB-linked SusC/RagA family outer membrane protein
MTKYLILLLLFSLLSSIGLAQDRHISGQVISSEDNKGIQGITVAVPNSSIGTITDEEGKYKLNIPLNTKQIQFSGIGFNTITTDLSISDSINITMTTNVNILNDVVITALGVKREEKSLGYAVQTLDGSEVSTINETNFINSLQGRIAGVSITGSSNLGGSSRIILRGVRSISFENQPLFIVDGVPIDNSNFATKDQIRGALGYDFGNAAQDINPDDIETINVLKGSTATALYGSQGANGVIIINSKKGISRTPGSGKMPIGITLSSGITFSEVSVLPEYQNRYGGGAASTLPNDPKTYSDFLISTLHPGEQRSNFEYDGSWGPEMLGQMVYQWNSYYPSMPNYNKKTPWIAHPDNIRDFYQTGITTTNNVAIDGGNANTLYRLSYTNHNQKGTIPNSSLNRNTFNFNGSNKFSDKLSSAVSITYVGANGKGRAQTGYNSLATNFTQWWERQIDMNELKDYKNPDGSQRTWNMNSETDLSPLFWNNPYWRCYENYETDQRNRIYGVVSLNYEISKGLNLSGAIKTDYYNEGRQERVALGSAAAESISKYSEENIIVNENNYEMMITYKTSLNTNFDLNAFAGVNRQDRKKTDNFITSQGGLNVPDYYSLTNSAANLLSVSNKTQLRRNSIYASTSIGYKRFLYLDLTGRNDFSSTLPDDNNSYFYPSVTGSYIFSEQLTSKWLSYGKIRMGWALTAIDPPPYSTGSTRPLVADNFSGFASAVTPNIANNPNLKPEKTSSFETGIEMIFLNGRASVEVTYYVSNSKDVVFPVQQSATTGYNSKFYNAAEIKNEGIELQLTGIPFQTKSGFKWGLGVNFAKNNNIVKKLFTDENGKSVESILIENAPFSVTFEARPGMAYGQIVGYDYAYDANGNHIIDPVTNSYAHTATVKPLGSVLPDYTGGVSTWFEFKGFKIFGLVDFQKGGKLFSLTNTFGKYSGTLSETAEEDIRTNGIVLEGVVQTGVDAEGNPTSDGTINTGKIAAVDHFFLDGGFIISAADVNDASYIKFRELAITYSFPKKWFKKTIEGASISLIGRNLGILYKKVPHIDPESAVSTNNIQGLEGGQLPSERTYGVSLNIKF